MAAAGFLSRNLNGLTPYNHKYNVLSASLNKTFPSFLFFTIKLNDISYYDSSKMFSAHIGMNTGNK